MTSQLRPNSIRCGLSIVAAIAFMLGSTSACRATRGSNLSAWTLDGSEEKAELFIVSTVYKHFPNLPDDRTVVTRFARGLMDKKEQHAESPDYILSTKSAQGPEALENYIVLEFATSTNVLEVADASSELKYLGPAPDQADTDR